MSGSIEFYLVWIAILLILSVVASKVSDRFGVPILILFLAFGMLAGADGPGGIYFDDPQLASSLGVVALTIILFSGGLDTSWSHIRPVLKEGILLATLGVVLTALSVGLFAHFILQINLMRGILIGAIVSSTDAAAVFAILRSKGISLKHRLAPLLELESGSNDPMAVFLTLGLIQLILQPELPASSLIVLFIKQMGLGLLFGFVAGKATLFLINRIKLGYAGLYPVLTLGTSFLAFGLTTLLGGSGFLAVYLAGVVMGKEEFLHKRSLLRFYDGLAWLMQIVMFFTLGLLVFPSHLSTIILPGLAVAAFLLFVARPLSVFASLAFTKRPWIEKLFVSWVGLRGAVPIVLATYPRIMGVEQSEPIFDLVFFVVVSSVLLQGATISPLAKKLKVQGEEDPQTLYPIEFVSSTEWQGLLKEVSVPSGSQAIGKAIFELGLPGNYLIVMISRGKEFILPNGSIVLEAGDKMLGLSDAAVHAQVETLLQAKS